MIEPRTKIVLPGKPIAPTLSFFRETLGMRLESIMPADDPQQAMLSAAGTRILLDTAYLGDAGLLRVASAVAREPLRAPNGTRIEFVVSPTTLDVPEPDDTPVITTCNDTAWNTGRAGMLYRDLIPGRMNGHLIASHIRIPIGGTVADDVHFHDVRFQMIYCYRGWVRLVYEDQGEAFVMQEGDCVVQPPKIRHRVLEASDGLEVIELACPSVHLTTLDHQLSLPSQTLHRDREFSGQRFSWHQHGQATWQTEPRTGWQHRDLGIAAATGQLARAEVLRGLTDATCNEPSLCFLMVLNGTCRVQIAALPAVLLATQDCATIPRNTTFALQNASDDLQLLRVRL
jgi:quercetin dioxygenase-like cupin family protein